MPAQRFVRWWCVLYVCGASLVVATLTAGAVEKRPNIIVILTDDMGYSDLGCYGGEIRTPHLDGLAAGGLRFTQFYNTARCCPTRACLLTGLYPHQAGVGWMTEDRNLPGYRGQLNDECVTIAEALQGAGYHSYATGKWHVTLNSNTRPDGDKGTWPLQRGFEKFYGTILGGGTYWDPACLARGNTMITAASDKEYQPQEQPYYYTHAITDNAVRFVKEHRQEHAAEPFFLYVAYTAAHWPLHALEKDIARYKGKYGAGFEAVRKARYEKAQSLGLIDSKWPLTPPAGDWQKVANKEWEARCMEVYAAQVDAMDQGVGRIVSELKAEGQLENTLILYMQDNGGCAENIRRNENARRGEKPTLSKIDPNEVLLTVIPKQTREGWPTLGGPHVMPGPADTYQSYGEGWANVSNTPFREYKHWVHEGGISTPLIAYWPARITDGGKLRTAPAHLIDIMATCLDVAGATYPAERAGKKTTPPEGASLVPVFAGKPLAERAIFWEHEGNRAVREGDWKLVAKGPGGKWELYNMAADRTELNNLATAEPERTRRLVSEWEAWAKRAQAIPWVWKPAYGEAAGPAAPVAKHFELKPGDDLERERAPQAAGQPLRIEATLEKMGDSGVLVAQGGTAHGYALYVHDKKLTFAARLGNKLHTLAAKEVLPEKARRLECVWAKGGKVTLRVDGNTVAEESWPGLLEQMPADGLQVGRDLKGAVGDYTAPNEFRGTIERVVIDVGEAG